MDGDKIISQLLDTIEGSISDFNKSMPGIQDQVLDSILELTRDLTIPAKTIEQQASNLRVLGKIKSKVSDLVLNESYLENVRSFVKTFDTVAGLQNKYFNTIAEEFSPSSLLKQIKTSYVDITIENLTESGVDVVSTNIREMLLRNVTSGGSYSSMLKEVQNYLTGENGALLKHARQITTDSINQYSASYTKAVTDDLGMKWSRFVGSNIKTTRDFCLALTAKDFYHEAELPEILKGHIGDRNVPLNPKTGLWYGAIDGTTIRNFQVNRGGWQCGHQSYPVPEAAVPKSIRIETYDRFGIKYDEEGFAVAA